jgi:hypothetical protein
VASLSHIYPIYYIASNKRVKIDNEELSRFWRALKNASHKEFLELTENTQFLGKEYGPSALFIRNCYLDLKNVIFDDKINKLRITGNPGIGKSFFGYYLLYLLAIKNTTVVYDHCKESDPFVFEGGKDAFISSSQEIKGYLRDSSVWYIVDGKEPKSVNAKTILICSPKREHYKHFDNYEGKVTMRYVPIWSWKEIDVCRANLYKDEVERELAEDLFSKWGGIPRYVLENANDELIRKSLVTQFKVAKWIFLILSAKAA